MSASPTGWTSKALTVGDAVGYGWARFKANPWTWIGAVLIAAVIQSVLNTLFGERSALRVDTFGQSFWTVNWIIGSILATVCRLPHQRRARARRPRRGGRAAPALGAFFRFANVGNVILASILVGVLTAIGFILFVIPGVIVAFLSWWTLQFVIDRDEPAIEGIRSSFRAISSQAGTLLLLALALIGINILGAIPLGLGLLVTVPLSIIASTYAYRVVSGGGVAP